MIRQTVYRWFVFVVGRNGALRIRYGAGCAYNRSGGEVRYGGEIRYGERLGVLSPIALLRTRFVANRIS